MALNFSPSSRWAFICGASVGVLVAFPLAAPLFDGEILEPVATLWGNALGAIGAVAAAIWAGDRAARLQQRQGAGLIVTFVDPVAESLADLTAFYIQSAPEDDSESQPPHLPDPVLAERIVDRCSSVNVKYYAFKKAGTRVEAILNHLGPAEMHVFLELEDELEAMDYAVNSLIHHASTANNDDYGHTPSTGLRTRLIAANSKVQHLVSRLRKIAR